jgi:tRNA pseudouridine55 synthase
MNESYLGGVLCIDKGKDQTSFDVVGAVRRLYQTKQVGHTGTLDPQATGVLVVLVGRAVKAAEYLVTDHKVYDARLQLGYTTDTQDAFGQTLTRHEGALPDRASVEEALAAFCGEIAQLPPMYSALKVNGQKLVDLARRGIEVERQSRPITVHSITLLDCDEQAGWYDIRVSCSKGTYIRTLCADIGAHLGCGGVMSALRRRKSGAFDLSQAITLEALKEMSEDEREAALLPTESLFCELDAIALPPFFARLAHCGVSLYQKKLGLSLPEGTRVRLCDDEGFFALGEARLQENEAMIKPIKQFKL